MIYAVVVIIYKYHNLFRHLFKDHNNLMVIFIVKGETGLKNIREISICV